MTDPDSRARTHLANERTFLAWFRTGVTLMALGLAAAQFPTPNLVPGIPIVHLLSIAIVGAGIALLVIGRRRYVFSRRHIDEASFRPAGSSVDFSVAMFTIVGVIAIVFIVLAPR
jgi:putative membrane protein